MALAALSSVRFTSANKIQAPPAPEIFGSLSGNGTSSYATFNMSTALGLDPFTIEAYVRFAEERTADHVFLAFGTSAATNKIELVLTGTNYGSTNKNKLTLRAYNSSSGVTSTTQVSPNTWYHVAAVRTGTGANGLKLYVNGVHPGGTAVNTYPISVTDTTLQIMRSFTNNSWVNGNMTSVRICNSALYTSNFTPPVHPVSSVGSTLFLLRAKTSDPFRETVSQNSITNNGLVGSALSPS